MSWSTQIYPNSFKTLATFSKMSCTCAFSSRSRLIGPGKPRSIAPAWVEYPQCCNHHADSTESEIPLQYLLSSSTDGLRIGFACKVSRSCRVFLIQVCIEENLTRTHAPGWQTWSQPKPSICLNGSPSPPEDDQADHSPGTKVVGHSLEYPQAQYQTDFHF